MRASALRWQECSSDARDARCQMQRQKRRKQCEVFPNTKGKETESMARSSEGESASCAHQGKAQRENNRTARQKDANKAQKKKGVRGQPGSASNKGPRPGSSVENEVTTGVVENKLNWSNKGGKQRLTSTRKGEGRKRREQL